MRFDRNGFYRPNPGMLEKLYDYLVQGWGRDSGHSGWAVVTTVVTWALMPDRPWLAAAIGSNVYAIPKEIWDLRPMDKNDRWIRPTIDTFSDYLTYQVGWPLVITLQAVVLRDLAYLGYGAGVFLALAAVYLFLVTRKL